MRFRRVAVTLVAVLFAAGCASGTATRAQSADERPSLILLITIDQYRTDYFDRWGHQFTGGLARLSREGAFFTEAVHDHAITETAPGHATLGSGRHPLRTGIAANVAGVVDPNVTLVGEPGPGASPFRFRGSSIADWLRTADRRSRIVSISMKDRGAILPLGRVRGEVYWYSPTGHFTTSTYYRRDLPRWVRDFNQRRLPQQWAGRQWDLLLDESAYPQPDSVVFEGGGVRPFVFPHVLPADTALAPQLLPVFPWMDDLTLGLALEAVRSLQLGGGGRTDLLAVSLSASDYIGHTYGPDSRELHDQVLRLDRSLGGFLDTLFTLVDPGSVVLALSADHGVGPIPELVGPTAHRVSPAALLTRFRAAVAAAGGDSLAIGFGSGALGVDRRTLQRAGVNVDSLLGTIAGIARAEPGIQSADRLSELAARDTVTDDIARRWLHMFEPGGEVELVVTLAPYSIWHYGATATHGSPHYYDARVPLVFWGSPFSSGRHAGPARTIDLAPTLARAAGIAPTEAVDGRVLDAALR